MFHAMRATSRELNAEFRPRFKRDREKHGGGLTLMAFTVSIQVRRDSWSKNILAAHGKSIR